MDKDTILRPQPNLREILKLGEKTGEMKEKGGDQGKGEGKRLGWKREEPSI